MMIYRSSFRERRRYALLLHCTRFTFEMCRIKSKMNPVISLLRATFVINMVTQRFTLRFIARKFQTHRSRFNVITDADTNVSFDDSEILDYQTISDLRLIARSLKNWKLRQRERGEIGKERKRERGGEEKESKRGQRVRAGEDNRGVPFFLLHSSMPRISRSRPRTSEIRLIQPNLSCQNRDRRDLRWR